MSDTALPKKLIRASRTTKSSFVLPSDTNTHGTLFGGKLMAYIDDIAAITASKHARSAVVTASADSIDFLSPIREGEVVSLESYVSWTHNTSMEVFVKIVAENVLTGKKKVCATSFLTFVALNEDGKPSKVPEAIPETKEEKYVHDGGYDRMIARKARRKNSEKMASEFGSFS
ncbi:acyl-CoA thioesterase [Alkalihalobacillus macyae]|uniref:acyl-CoA thioesterase n=1 Tax=Guptibacillus hwajinpoensis TaxID=208199 RepID=UPI00273BE302|nr:acyl-CoA thioesterase [Alkalihalobacillus macyae]MDP4551359.1 acyl-CoA thioesterase [Alkalihalobacillus macyae]